MRVKLMVHKSWIKNFTFTGISIITFEYQLFCLNESLPIFILAMQRNTLLTYINMICLAQP
jgi:hypothetical protein